MARLEIAFAFLVLLVEIVAIVNCALTPDSEIRYMPKWLWILLILFFPAVGGVLWLAVGKERPAQPVARRASGWRGQQAVPPPPAQQPGRYSRYDHDERIRQIEAELAALESEDDQGDPRSRG